MLRALVVGLLLWSAQATIPQDLVARAAATCNRDNCYREVFGITTPGRSASGVAACTSYLQKTVSPCPTTTTSTTTTTTTVATTTSTSTASTTTTSTTTLSFTSTSTVTTTVTGVAPNKRDLEARTVTPICSPVTTSASSTGVPKYASDCTGTRFSSVCTCNGNIPTATTLPTVTATAIATATSSVTASTATVTTFTATDTLTTSTTTTTTSTSTVYVPPAPTCTPGTYTSFDATKWQIQCGYIYNTVIIDIIPAISDVQSCVDQCERSHPGSFGAVNYEIAAETCYCMIDGAGGTATPQGLNAAVKIN